jgi:diacylglycerol kinase family enzyme
MDGEIAIDKPGLEDAPGDAAGEATGEAPREGPGRDEFLIVMNPHSGKKRTGEKARQLRAEIEKHPGRFVIREARGGHLEAVVKAGVAEGYRTIVAAGGDGTICAVASALVGTGCRLGVVPLGTFNYFARGNGLPETIPEAVEALMAAQPRSLDIAEVNGRVFLNNASLGAYAKVLESRERIYEKYGRSRVAAYWSVLAALANFRTRLRAVVTVDGEVHRFKTPMIFVAANPFQLELFNLAGADEIRAGKLVALVAPDVGRWGLIAFAVRLALGGMSPERDFRLLAGREMTVETRRRATTVARDGERGRIAAPFRFRLHSGALKLLAPPPEAEAAPASEHPGAA